MAYYKMDYKPTVTNTTLLAITSPTIGTDYNLTESIYNFDFIQLLIGGSSSGYLAKTEFVPISLFVGGANVFSGQIYIASVTIIYQIGFSSATKFRAQTWTTSNNSYPLYVKVNGIRIV